MTDTGEADGYRSFATAVGKRPAVIQTFHPWGNSLSKSLPRWRSIRARPMLHITTKADDGTELITPRQIALGIGDDYLVKLNTVLSRRKLRTYIRPMGEPNRCLNPYSGVDCAGNVRGGDYAFRWYRAAFRRIAVIVRGGAKRGWINARLKKIGLPKVQRRTEAPVPRKLRAAPVSMIWSPLPLGIPDRQGELTRPATGRVANGSTGSPPTSTPATTTGTTCRRFYVKWAKGKRKPMALTEWGLWGEDSPAYVHRIFRFARTRERVRMMVYYQDFGSSNEFRIQNFPRALRALRSRLAGSVFPRYAPRFPRLPR